MRSIRDTHGVTAEDVAAQARAHGLSWQRSTVASIEIGRRGLSVEEFVLLPAILTEALRQSGGWDEKQYLPIHVLLEALPSIEMNERLTLPGDALQRVMDGGPLVVLLDESLESMASVLAPETERHAARVLDVEPGAVLIAAVRIWGHGLTEERDRRAAEQQPDDEARGSRRTRRGHITRQLIEELRAELEGTGDGQR